MKKYKFLTVSLTALASFPLYAQEANTVAEKTKAVTGEELLLILFGATVVAVALVALMFCAYFLHVLNSTLNPSTTASKPAVSVISWLNEKFGVGKLKPIEEEGEVALEHSYDGIVELDNGMPPWLKYLFTSSIIFAVIYLFNYLILDSGLNQLQEYEQELAVAEKQSEERKLLAANSLDESNVTMVEDKSAVDQGKTLYDQNCKACHGAIGEGGVGPNLTDPYWIHGGTINDVFKTIKYGVPEKGMIAWQAKLKPVEIQNVSSYILSLQGSNPPNGKAPQGELFDGETTVLK